MAGAVHRLDTVTVARQALEALQRSDTVSYGVLRQRLASLVAPEAGVDPALLDGVWSLSRRARG